MKCLITKFKNPRYTSVGHVPMWSQRLGSRTVKFVTLFSSNMPMRKIGIMIRLGRASSRQISIFYLLVTKLRSVKWVSISLVARRPE